MAKPPGRLAQSPRMTNTSRPLQPRVSNIRGSSYGTETPWRELRSNMEQPNNPQMAGLSPLRMSNRPKKGLRNSRVTNLMTVPPPVGLFSKDGYKEGAVRASNYTDTTAYNPLQQTISESGVRRPPSYVPLYQPMQQPQEFDSYTFPGVINRGQQLPQPGQGNPLRKSLGNAIITPDFGNDFPGAYDPRSSSFNVPPRTYR